MTISKEIIKNVIISQKEQRKETNLVDRDQMNKLIQNKNNPFVQIITGIRRCGKSTLLHQLSSINPDSNYFINFDDNRLFDFSVNDFEKLNDSFLDLFGEENTYYFDEIQNIKGWELYVRRLYNEGKKVFITGSNAHMFSRELGTHLTGINLRNKLFPFSFREFLRWKEFMFKEQDKYSSVKAAKIRELFSQYMSLGGMPEYLESLNQDILKNLYENIIYRDVIVRHKLKQEKPVIGLLFYLISNISKESSYNALKNMLGLSNANTVKEYIAYFEQSYLLFSINKFDYSLKKQLINPKKIYTIDTGIANSISFRFSKDQGRQLENIVFLELKRRGYEIYYHKGKSECDFLLRKASVTIAAIQVSLSLNDTQTREREITGLLEAMQDHELTKGYILTFEEKEEINREDYAIIVMPVWEWLLNIET